MSTLVLAPEVTRTPCKTTNRQASNRRAVACEAIRGLAARPKTLSPWLFYDEAGSHLFEQITALPEYYLTRTERGILSAHADSILSVAAGDKRIDLLELGAGTATKTGLLLRAAVRRQGRVVYRPIDVSETALEEARDHIEANIPGVTVHPQVANYISEPLRLERTPSTRTLALYIGSSIGNFAPAAARDVLRNLRADLHPGDSLLLGTDLGPGPNKDEPTLLAAYNDADGITAAFNLNLLTRLNRELDTDFHPEAFAHKAIWNPQESRIEMHLESLADQQVRLPASPSGPNMTLRFAAGETIHTENSYKFTEAMVTALLRESGFTPTQTWHDPDRLFAVTLATAV